MISTRSLLLLFCMMLALASLRAQDKSCPVGLPVGLIDKGGNLLNGLTAHDLTVQLRKQKLHVEDVTYDTGARRVLLIVDTSRQLPPDVRKAEVALATHILANARGADSFALLTARGASRQVRFDQGNQAVMKALQELSADPKEDKKATNLLDTIMEATNWFGRPQPGDAMLVMSDHLEGPPSSQTSRIQRGYATDVTPSFEDSHFKFKTVADALAQHGIRVFGVQFGPISVDFTFEPNDENLIGMALGSGGFLLVDSMDPFGGYQLTEARLQGLQHRVYQLYGAIAQFYVLKVQAPMPLYRQQWKLELASDLRQNTRALYPRWFDPCGSVENH